MRDPRSTLSQGPSAPRFAADVRTPVGRHACPVQISDLPCRLLPARQDSAPFPPKSGIMAQLRTDPPWAARPFDVDVAVIGAGLVGLATARELALGGWDVLVLERRARIGEETSSHLSQVMHSGIYYEPGSLKARLCVRGRQLLEAFAAARGIPYRRIGKLVVAQTPEEALSLEDLRARGEANGVFGLELWDRARAAQEEPGVRCLTALFVPVTGILDVSALLGVLRQDLESQGGVIALSTRVTGLVPQEHGGWTVTAQEEEAPGAKTTLSARFVVNAAGLGSDHIATLSGLSLSGIDPTLHPARGHYMRIRDPRRVATKRLVYPVPAPHLAGLGIHLTWTVSGEALLGPDVEWLDTAGDPPRYRVDPSRLAQFAKAASRYLPDLGPEDLVPDMAGIRPKLSGPGEPPRDFLVTTDPNRPGIVHLIGIESPGFTSCLALAEEAVFRLGLAPAPPGPRPGSDRP